MPPPPIISTSLALAFKTHLSRLVYYLLAVTISAALISTQFSGRQPATVTMDIGLSLIRLLLPLALVLTIQELISREFDKRYYLNTLTYPYSRHKLLLGRFIATAAFILSLLVVLAGTLALSIYLTNKAYTQSTTVALGIPYVVTVAFIGIDLLLLTSVATLLAVIASSPSFVLFGTFGFMLAARSFGPIVELLTRNRGVVSDAESYRSGVGILGYLLPDMGALDVRMITLYSKMELLPTDWPWLVLSSLTYTAGLLALAVWALQRKRFA